MLSEKNNLRFLVSIMKKRLTSINFCTRFIDTPASTNPFRTHGKAFNGPISIFRRATLAKVVDAVNGFPSNVDTPNVRRHIRIGVVAQK